MKTEQQPNHAITIANFLLNKYMPFVLSAFLMFYYLGFDSFVPYAVIGLMWFAKSYSFNCGMAHAILATGIRIDEDTSDENYQADSGVDK